MKYEGVTEYNNLSEYYYLDTGNTYNNIYFNIIEYRREKRGKVKENFIE